MHMPSALAYRVPGFDEDFRRAERFVSRYLKETLFLREGETFRYGFFDMGNGLVLRVLTEVDTPSANDPQRSFYTLVYDKLADGSLLERDPKFWDFFMRAKSRFVYAASGYFGLLDQMSFLADITSSSSASAPLSEPGMTLLSYAAFLQEEPNLLREKEPQKEAPKQGFFTRASENEGAISLVRRKLTSSALRRHLAALGAGDGNEVNDEIAVAAGR